MHETDQRQEAASEVVEVVTEPEAGSISASELWPVLVVLGILGILVLTMYLMSDNVGQWTDAVVRS